MSCPGCSEDPLLQVTIRKLTQKQQQKPPQTDRGGAMSAVWQGTGAAPGSLRRVRFLLGISEVQVCEAEPDRRNEVPEVRRRRSCRTQGPERQHLLGLHQLPEMRLHFELQTGSEEVPQVQEPVSAGEDAQVRSVLVLPQQQACRSGSVRSQEGRSKEGCGCQKDPGENYCCDGDAALRIRKADWRRASSSDSRNAWPCIERERGKKKRPSSNLSPEL